MSATTMTGDDRIVATHGLCKVYGGHVALDDVTLAVPRAGVYGLVGPNGAGKTTLLSILLGTRRATAGTVELSVDRSRITAVPDTPQFDPWLTGREVVDLSRSLIDPSLPQERVAHALGDTGLADAADRRVGGYSRGMLQRVGLAAAIVAQPELLILDEPASALDPAGRRDVLDLVSDIGREATVLFSSHILADVQQVSDTVGILREGALLWQGPLEDLLVGRAAPAVEVRLRRNVDTAADRLRREPWVTHAESVGAGRLRVTAASLEELERHLVPVLAHLDAPVVSLTPVRADLEHVFLELTS
ncbi:MAG: ABC transporter ATP-binding protein [Nitriliruptoraceae bacterium]